MSQLTQQERTADEVLLARAEAKGYRRGAFREADKARGLNVHIPKTKKCQEDVLRRYVLWHLSAMKKEAAESGMPPPDEQTARERYLGQNVTAPDLATLKDFVRFYIAIGEGVLDEEEGRPTPKSINVANERFFAGFVRITGTEIVKEDRRELYNWVRLTLTAEGIVVIIGESLFRCNYDRAEADK